MKSNLSLRKSTSTHIIEARDLPDCETEHLLEEVSVDQLLRTLTGQSPSKIAAGSLLADEWD